MSEKTIHEAINAVMKEVGYVQKVRGGDLKYSYAGEAALIEALRPSMVEHGIYASVAKVNSVTREQYQTKSGTNMTNTLTHVTVRFTHAPSNTWIDVETTGEGSDSGDKSSNKAMTGGYKYALRQTFCIETGDDPDKFSSDEQERPPRVLPQKPAPEIKTVVPATDHAKVKKAFSQAFAQAKSLGIEVETISGSATDEEIVAATKKIESKIKAANGSKVEA